MAAFLVEGRGSGRGSGDQVLRPGTVCPLKVISIKSQDFLIVLLWLCRIFDDCRLLLWLELLLEVDVRFLFSCCCCLLSVSLQEPTVVNSHFNSLCFLVLIFKKRFKAFVYWERLRQRNKFQ